MGPRTTHQVLNAWEKAASEPAFRRPVTLLAELTGQQRPDVESLTVGQFDGIVLQVRSLLFGEQVGGVVRCASCGTEIETSFTVRDVTVPRTSPPASLQLVHGGRTVTVRPVTAGDLEASRASADPGAALLARAVGSLGGPIDEATRVAVGLALQEADPQSAIVLNVECPDCTAVMQVPFLPFLHLWAELSLWANGVFRQVHRLARAYGWSEAECLGLSPARRARYLEMIGA